MLSVSKRGLIELIGHEAIVQTPYKDSKGVWTIGVGHTRSAGPPDPRSFGGAMTLEKVVELFQADIGKFADDVNSVLKVTVSQAEFDALVSFHFNTGGIKRASLIKSLNAGDRKKAAEEFMNWNKPPEIVGRRSKEQKLFAEGAYSGAGKVTVYPADDSGSVQWKKGRSVDISGMM
ncbi:hypothetical protein LMIY3S_01102 [Labrys miyagiensis]